jgi:hypothetical protein
MLILLRAMLILRHYAADAIFASAMPMPIILPPPLSPLFTPPLMPLRHYYFSMLFDIIVASFFSSHCSISLPFSLFSSLHLISSHFLHFTFSFLHYLLLRLITEASFAFCFLFAISASFLLLTFLHCSSFHFTFLRFHYFITLSLFLFLFILPPFTPLLPLLTPLRHCCH